MKKLHFSIFTIAALLSSASAPVHSFTSTPNCGEGYIIEMTEGGWNNGRIHVKLNFTNPAATGMTMYNGYIRFANLSAVRRQAIRQLAHVAISNSMKVGIHSHNGTCREATQMLIEP